MLKHPEATIQFAFLVFRTHHGSQQTMCLQQCRQLSNGVQVQRLIAVLSVPGVSRRKVLEGSSLDPGPNLTDQERKQLEAAGWTPGTTIRSLLNFTGLSLAHQAYVACCINDAFSTTWLALVPHIS